MSAILEQFSLSGRVAIVTGASSGLGERFARVLADAGATVVAAARRLGRLESLACEVDGVVPIQADLLLEDDRASLVAAALERFGRVDVLVNNAGGGSATTALTEPIEDFRRNLELNLVATFDLCQRVAPHMIVLGANLVTCLPDTNHVRAALQKLDLLVVLEVMQTETTAIATHVLPVHAQLERPDVSMLNDLFNPIVSTQYTPAVLPQSSGRRSAWWTLARIGQALGETILPGSLDVDTATDDDVVSYVVGSDTVDKLRTADLPWAVSARPVHGWVEDRLPIGTWDLAPRPLLEQLASMQTPPSPLVLIPRRQPKRMNGRTIRDGDRPEVLLHPVDAKAAGVGDGELVDVVSSVGTIRLTVRVTEATRSGAASIAHGWADANVNLLVDGHLVDPLTGMPSLSGTPVSIYPARAKAHVGVVG